MQRQKHKRMHIRHHGIVFLTLTDLVLVRCHSVVVAPELRRRGIAGQLVRYYVQAVTVRLPFLPS